MPLALQRRIQGRHDLLAIIHNSGWLLLDKMLRLVLGLLVGAWVARYLGPSQFGELAYVLAYIALFQSIANLGLDGIVVRDIAQNKLQTPYLLGTVFVLRLCVGIICWISAICGMALMHGLSDRIVLITALSAGVLVFQSADTIDLWFQSQSQSRRTILAKLTAFLFSSAIKVVLIFNEATLYAFIAVILFEAMFCAVGLAVAYKRFPCYRPWKLAGSTARQLLKESWPFILSGISIVIYMRIDQIMIKEMLGSRQLGIYAAVLPLATIWQIIPTTLNASLAPFIASKKNESEVAYWLALKKIFKLYGLLAWLVCIPTAILANFIVDLLYGEQFQQGALVLTIYVFTNLFINMGVAQGLWLLNERRAIISLANTFVGAVICFFGNLLLIPIFGIVGVAMVAVMAQLFSTVLTNLVFAKRIFIIQIRSIAWPF